MLGRSHCAVFCVRPFASVKVINETLIECVDSDTKEQNSFLQSQRVAVWLTFNGDTDWALAKPPNFTMIAKYAIEKVSPSAGPNEGGTPVTIVGTSFGTPIGREALQCRFGTRVVAGTLLSQTQVTCTSPVAQDKNAMVDLTLSLNGQDFSLDVQPFQYYTQARITSVDPPGGLVSGSTEVKVRGDFLQNQGKIKCCWDESGCWGESGSASAGELISEPGTGTPLIVCKSTPLKTSHSVRRSKEILVEVALNGVQFTNTTSTSRSAFLYYTQPQIIATKPWGGPSVGGANITVIGDGFFDAWYLRGFYTCKFTTEAGAAYKARAVFVNTTEMECSKPSNLLETSFIDIAMNANDFTDTKQFRYSFYTQLVFESMFPLAGAVRGGTVINVKSRSPDFGSLNKFKMSFKESQLQDMLCRFSDRDSRSEVVPAHISDDGDYITCQAAPAWSVPNVVTVSVAVNGVDFFSAVAVREAEFYMTWQPDVKQVCVQCLRELWQSYSRARPNRTALLVQFV